MKNSAKYSILFGILGIFISILTNFFLSAFLIGLCFIGFCVTPTVFNPTFVSLCLVVTAIIFFISVEIGYRFGKKKETEGHSEINKFYNKEENSNKW